MKRLVLALAMLLLVGTEARADVTLNVASELLFRANLKGPYQTLIKTFEQRHPGIKINAYGYPLAEYHAKILTEMAAGNAPDICESVAMTFYSHAKVGKGFMPLDSHLDQWAYLGGEGFDKAMMADFMVDGKISALPVGGASWGYAYWKPAFTEAGIRAENLQTWDDLIEAAKKLTIDRDKDGRIDQYGLGLTNGRDTYDILHWEQLAWTIGGGFFPSDQGPYTAERVSVNSPASVHAMELMADAVHKHKVVVPGVWTSEKAATDLLLTKKAAIVFVHLGMIEGFRMLKPDEFQNIGWLRKMSVNWQGKTWKPGRQHRVAGLRHPERDPGGEAAGGAGVHEVLRQPGRADHPRRGRPDADPDGRREDPGPGQVQARRGVLRLPRQVLRAHPAAE